MIIGRYDNTKLTYYVGSITVNKCHAGVWFRKLRKTKMWKEHLPLGHIIFTIILHAGFRINGYHHRLIHYWCLGRPSVKGLTITMEQHPYVLFTWQSHVWHIELAVSWIILLLLTYSNMLCYNTMLYTMH